MSPYNKPIRILLAAASSLLIYAQAANAQDVSSQAQDDTDVVKISTQLVQTSVTVQDKQGRFVDGLKKEDFELKVDGKPVEVSFFERIAAGTPSDAVQTAGVVNATTASTAARPISRGRVVAFFIDDMHISAGNLKKAKEAISKYIDKEMGQNDLVAITSASGQIGFLQQYTDNKDVLRAALARLSYKSFDVTDVQIPVISYYQALQVDRGDRSTLGFLADETLRSGIIPTGPGGQITEQARGLAEEHVKQRVGFILKQGSRMLLNTLSTLESLIRYSAPIPGRKLVFLISDGFFLDTRTGNVTEKMRSITDASTRSGVVIYSMDAKGLVTGMEDPRVGQAFDPFGMSARSSGGEFGATQDGINALAVDTGGRLISNTNGLDSSLSAVLKETSVYYMLAWRPETDPQKSGKFRRIDIDVKNRAELSVRVQRGYYDNPAATTASAEKPKKSDKKSKSKPPTDPLTKALVGRYPQKELPTELTLSYMNATNNAAQLVASMKIEGSRIRFETANAKSGGVIDIEGVVFDSQGKRMDGFRTRLIAPAPTGNVTNPKLPDITYNYYASLKPGLYQVRVASRYEANGLLGSAVQWVEIPDLTKQRLSLSSLILGERKSATEEEKKAEAQPETVPISVDRRFERSSSLRFLVYIYNAARAAAATQPQVELQVQILRDEKPVATSPMRKISTEAQDMTRLAYAAEFPLQEMSTGQYILQVTAIDRVAKTTASQRVRFEVQ